MNYYTSDGRDLRAEIAPYLNADEDLLWAGKPASTKSFRPNSAIVIFMLFWLGFAVFWTIAASATGGAFGLFGLPFVAIGVVVLCTSTVGPRKQLKSAVYAVTDQRAIILYSDRHGTNCVQHLFANTPSVSLERVQGTVGTIRFSTDVFFQRSEQIGHGYASYRVSTRHTVNDNHDIRNTFVGIEGVQTVYRLISEQIAGSR